MLTGAGASSFIHGDKAGAGAGALCVGVCSTCCRCDWFCPPSLDGAHFSSWAGGTVGGAATQPDGGTGGPAVSVHKVPRDSDLAGGAFPSCRSIC